MQRGHEVGQLAEQRDDLIGQIFRMRGCEANALDARGGHRAQYVGEARLAIQIAPVGVHVLAEQRDFLHAIVDKRLRFGGHVFDGARFFAASYVRHNAIGAEVVTARGNGQPCGPCMHALAGQVGGEFLAGLVHFGLVSLAHKHRLNEARQAIDVLRAEYHVNMRQLFHELRAVALADAAANAHDALVELATLRKRNVLHRGDLAHKARIGGFAHAARHEYDDFRFFELGHLNRAERFEHARDSLGIVFVHLATENLQEKGLIGNGRQHTASYLFL